MRIKSKCNCKDEKLCISFLHLVRGFRMKTEEDYQHYADCKLPLKECTRCRWVIGNLPESAYGGLDLRSK